VYWYFNKTLNTQIHDRSFIWLDTDTSIKPFTHKYLTGPSSGLIQTLQKTLHTQIHDRFFIWLDTGTSIKPSTHKYMTGPSSGLTQALQ